MQKLHHVLAAAAARSRDADGQTLVEYGLILALIAVVCIGILTSLGGGIVTNLTQVSNAI